MNILIVGPDKEAKGGIATVINNCYLYDHPDEYRFFFLSSWSEERKWWTQLRAFFCIRKVVNVNKIDLVHFHVAQKGSFFRKALLSKLVPKSCCIFFHMHASQFDIFYNQSNKFMKTIIGRVLQRIDHIIVLSKSWQEFYKKLTDTDISIINNAVDLPENVYYNKDATHIVTFGRVGQRKGSYDILTVAKQIAINFPDIRFVLYGDGEVEKVQEHIKREQITNVILGGWVHQEEKEKIFQNTVLHFLPSYNEGLPMSILETMAVGIPNISTRVGGIPEVIDGENSLLVEPGDTDTMTTLIQSFLSNERQRTTYSKKARETISKNFSQEEHYQSWYRLYSKYMDLKTK